MDMFTMFIAISLSLVLSFVFLPKTFRYGGQLVGRSLRRASRMRRELLLARAATEQRAYESDHKAKKEDDDWEEVEASMVGSAENGGKADRDWSGVVGFFHPFCNAGGGGERVLWAAIRATQKRWPEAICVVYTGDHDVNKHDILRRVEERFNIHLHPPTVHFLYLTTRHYVLSSTWPRFTLLGQSIGSVILAYDAFSLLVPDIFVDTMGYAFSLAFSSLLFPTVPTGAYVHYPTISTDMLSSLDAGGQGVNAGTGEGYRGLAKRQYWHLFARLYSKVGSTIDVVMTNSTWTQSHIRSLWSPYRNRRNSTSNHDIDVVFPPVAVEELETAIDISQESERTRGPYIVYIAQFRPEKNHQLIIEAFASFLASSPKLPSLSKEKPKLILIGSVRGDDDATRVYNYRLLAHELNIKEQVEFVCDAKWPEMLNWMQRSSVGVNGMWNEHFGIGVVEYQAAGLISVVNNSGGPKLDIVVEIDGKPTGFHASTSEEYADGFRRALSMSPEETLAMRRRARKSAGRFTDKGFADKWLQNMDQLVRLQISRSKRQ
ncbi:glycosyltransferase family 4 protein [Periconia macrospinosa]|uniref:GDP-Man:Man(3)GlcNAc(2)-PP-Dol alpha-1,2-mannosyltransferase n=1 Tax=Periconia macrospinosa TaxID=97972 RepID=A0A2V1ECB5_9PLEO|nr:glycosyltransferase family 4 protein [Periconia macrospinosa]